MGSIDKYIFRTTLASFALVLVSLTGVIWITQALRGIDLMTSQGQTILTFLGVTSLVIPALKGKLDGYSMRVPTPNVSVVDLTVTTEKPVTVEGINAALKKAAEGPMKGILAYTEEELVSIDFRANPNSAIVDAGYTRVVDGTCAKVLAWYDNEWGYSCRVVDLIKFLAAKL